MPLINTSVPNLIQGVSQQADAVRYDGQCEEQVNALSSVVDGLKKRPNTRHVGRLLGSAISSDSFVHFVDRSDTEKYVIIHDGTTLRAFNILTGASVSITGTSSYLNTSTPRQSLKALTVADSTFLLNTETEIALGTDTSPSLAKNALVFIKQGDYKKKYGFDVTVTTTVGQNATIEFTSTQDGKYFEMGTSNIINGGTGFAVGDIVDIPLVTSKSATYTYFTGSTTTSTVNLQLLTQPTFKVTAVGAEGVITSVSIENAGRFRWRGSFDGTYRNLGTGTTYPFNVKSVAENITISSTGSTPVSSAQVNLSKTFTSGTSEDSAAENADSSVILTEVAKLTTVEGTGNPVTNLGHASSGAWNTYFDTDISKLDSNILVLEAKSTVVDFTITPKDGLSGGGIGIIYKEVGSISDLPTIAKNGFEVKVSGDAELNQDDYYVRFETTGGEDIGSGSWVECVAPNLPLGYNSNTLPAELVSEPSGFTLRTMKFADRIAGDNNSNPLASFVGNTIDNLFFFKNRLGFLSADNIVMSESGLGSLDSTGQLNFNFGRTTVTTLLDSDPIDVSVASSRVTNLLAAKGFQENLVLFSENGQFVMKGGDVLTPKTVSITPITNFDVESAVDPLPVGSYIYFPFKRGNFTGLREFAVNANTDNYDSIDVTEHVPSYVPSNIIDMAGTTTEDLIALLSADEPKSLYIYKYFWSGNKKVLSSWSKFTITDDIRGIEFIDSTLYLVTVDTESNTHLLELPLEAGLTDVDHNGNTAGFLTLLDKRVRAKIDSGSSVVKFLDDAGNYSSANTDLPYKFFNGTIPSGGQTLSEVFIDSTGTSYPLKYQNIGNGGQPFLTSGTASSDLYGYVGLPYTMSYKFSTQAFKAQSGNSKSPTSTTDMQIRSGSLFFSDTHKFDVKVTPEQRSTATNSFDAASRPEADTLGSLKFAEGHYKFPVYSKAKLVDIVIENSSAFDSKFTSAEFESFVHPRSRRYG